MNKGDYRMQEKIYEKIFENLEDLLAEEQAKLGYRKEPVRFYYGFFNTRL